MARNDGGLGQTALPLRPAQKTITCRRGWKDAEESVEGVSVKPSPNGSGWSIRVVAIECGSYGIVKAAIVMRNAAGRVSYTERRRVALLDECEPGELKGSVPPPHLPATGKSFDKGPSDSHWFQVSEIIRCQPPTTASSQPATVTEIRPNPTQSDPIKPKRTTSPCSETWRPSRIRGCRFPPLSSSCGLSL